MPDMITFAKGCTSAYIPLSGIGVRDNIFDFFRQHPLGYGSTYFAHPVACAASYATIKYMIEKDIVGHVQKMEAVMMDEMSRLVDTHPCLKQARVYGLGAGFDLANKDGNFLMQMHEPHEGATLMRNWMRDEGLISFVRGHHLHCCPPLVIQEHELREAFQMLDRSLHKMDDYILNLK
jgi:taurine--2-oxoglutarate transaminase